MSKHDSSEPRTRSAREIMPELIQKMQYVRDHPEEALEVWKPGYIDRLKRIINILERSPDPWGSAAWRLADLLGEIATLMNWEGTGISGFTGKGFKISRSSKNEPKTLPARAKQPEISKVSDG